MLRQGSFLKNKYYKLLFSNLFGWAAYGVNIMIDSLVGGYQLGEPTLTAVAIVSPLFSVVLLCSLLISCGFAILYGKAIGEFDKDHAFRIAGQSLFSSLAISALMAVAMLVVKKPFLNYYECTGKLLEQASAYYNWSIVYMAVYPIRMTLERLDAADGDALIPTIGNIGEIASNIVLSIVLCQRLGVDGLGISTCASAVISAAVCLLHYLRKTNSVHFRSGWSWRDLGEALVLSSSCAFNFIFIIIVDLVMNKVILISCGMTMIPAYSVINLIFNLLYINGAPYDSCAGFCATFLGEKNNYGIRIVMRFAKRSLFRIGVVMMALCFFGAPYVPLIYGLTTPELVSASVTAARIMAFTAIPYGFAYFGYCIYASLDKPIISLQFAFLNNLLCPLVFSVPFAFLWGFTGVSIGMSLSAFLVIALFTLFAIKKKGKKDFPLYLKEYGEEVVGFDVQVERDNIVPLRDAVCGELTARGYEIRKIDLLIEELYTRISEKNPDKKILSECVLFFGEKQVRIIVRDNGAVFNFADEDGEIESLSAYVLNNLLRQTEQKNYVLTTSFNRHCFVFEKDGVQVIAPC